MLSRSDWRTLGVLFAIAAALNIALLAVRPPQLAIALPYSSLAFFFPVTVSFVGFWLFFFGMLRVREQRPLASTRKWLFEVLPRFLFAVLALQVISFGLSAFTALKIALPSVRPFSDFALARMDTLLLGNTPWTHWAISRAVLPAIDAIYECWSLVQAVFVAIVALSGNRLIRDRALITYILVWALGLAIAYLIPTAGPIFYDRAYSSGAYAQLDGFLAGSGTAKIADYLWSSGGVLGGGIFAMPSIHVAGAVWIAVVVKNLWPRIFPVALIYAAIIAFGSVFLGWHYLSDGAVGCALTWLAWRLASQGLMLRRAPLRHRAHSIAHPQGPDGTRSARRWQA